METGEDVAVLLRLADVDGITGGAALAGRRQEATLKGNIDQLD